MLLPFAASQLVTTDYVLAVCETLAIGGSSKRAFAGARRPRGWIAVMWLGLALAFLTKGPPALLPLLVVLLFDQLMPGRNATGCCNWSGMVLFALLALPWYVAVIHGNPGLFEYFIGDEVINRITTNEFGRHGEWYGWIEIYVPTLLLGTLPWTPTLWRWAQDAVPASVRRWRGIRRTRRAMRLRCCWRCGWCAAAGVLPVALAHAAVPPAAVRAAGAVVATQRQREGRPLPRWPRLAAWVVVLLALKVASAFWPTHKDAAVGRCDSARMPVTGP